MMVKTDRNLLISTIILVVLLVIILFIQFFGGEKIEAREFAGRITKAEGDSIFMVGNFVLEGNRADSQREEKMIEVTITPGTKIIKTLVYLPGLEEVGPDGKYDPSTLKRETTDGSKDDLTEGRSNALVKSNKNIFGNKKFEAASIEYIEPVYP